jgi:hydrogenase/urease accessory protein HupE
VRCRLWLILAIWVLCDLPAVAHESRPALLQLTETEPGRYDVLWKRPQRGDLTLRLGVAWPADCRDLAPPTAQIVRGAMIERRLVECDKAGLIGRRIGIDGLDGTVTDVLMRIEFLDGRVQTNLLTPASPWLDVRGPPPALAVATDYFVMGVEHILLGIDHLLFVLGLVLIVQSAGLLVETITAFTIAHSITLVVATLGFVHVPQAPVEAVIALSIVFLASELARRRRGEAGLTARYPWLVAFSFGLLHGFGFAGTLAEVGLPDTDIPLALLMFNLGVETGQLLFVAVILSLVRLGRPMVVSAPRWLQDVPAYAIGSLAAFWLIQRVAALS